jgi:hypothetical protein
MMRGQPVDDARPAGEFVKDLVDNVVSDDIEEVFTIDVVTERPSNQLKVRPDGFVRSVFCTRHPRHSTHFKRLLMK